MKQADEGTQTALDPIIVSASREPLERPRVSDATSVLSAPEVEALGVERVAPLLRLLPSVALAESGPAGSQAQVRIRGTEANHSLLFVDGIKANDPAAGNEARFELLGAASGDRIELVRGPQSALWGAEAIGGVVALQSVFPAEGASPSRLFGEVGSAGAYRAQGDQAVNDGGARLRASLAAQGAEGIDSFDGDGERDGYALRTARLAGSLDIARGWALLASGFAIDGRSEYDGTDPLTFRRADTLDETENRLGAGRLGVRYEGPLRAAVAASLLASSNVNRLDGAELNRTDGERATFTAQGGLDRRVGQADLRFTAAIDHESENFRAEDVAFGGSTRQDRNRRRTAWIGEGRLGMRDASFDVALRHDDFGDFEDATSLSAGLRVPIGDLLLFANYGEGIAQPTFYDLYGFFPGNFVGNDALRPERSRGVDGGVRYDDGRWDARLTLFAQDLEDEIVATFDPETFLSSVANGVGRSRRRGVEVEAGYLFGPALRLSANYSFLDAGEPLASDGQRLAETRRPRHRGALLLTGEKGRLGYGASIAYVGERFDTDFDLLPAQRVRLSPYAVASARLAYAITDHVELSLRGTNLLDADYRDVVGYRTQGRALFVGLGLTR